MFAPAESLAFIYDTLAPGGFLCFYESTGIEPALCWGLARECWNFKDERDFSLWCSIPRWESLLNGAGFKEVCVTVCICQEFCGLIEQLWLHVAWHSLASSIASYLLVRRATVGFMQGQPRACPRREVETLHCSW